MTEADPKPLGFRPMCKYGHGNLEKEKAGLFSLINVVDAKTIDGQPPPELLKYSLSFNSFYVVAIWKCTTCGYIELFDMD